MPVEVHMLAESRFGLRSSNKCLGKPCGGRSPLPPGALITSLIWWWYTTRLIGVGRGMAVPGRAPP